MRRDPPPPIPIGPVLTELGADIVPTGFGWIRMRCWAHPDASPSAAVNHQLRAFICHQCGRSGDAIKLLREEEGLSYADSLARAKTIAGVESEHVPRTGWSSGSLLTGTGD